MKKNAKKKPARRTYQWPEDPRWWAVRQTGEVASELGCHRNAAYKHRATRGLPSPPPAGGPGMPQRVKDKKIRLDKSPEWNAKRQSCGVGWMKVRMERLRKQKKFSGL